MAFHFKSIASAAVLALTLSACNETTTTGGNVVTDNENRNVVIVNRTGETIWRFFGSRVTTDSWEEDILGETVLAAGRSISIDFDDGTGSCLFDMMSESRNGSRIVKNEIDVCRVSEVVFN